MPEAQLTLQQVDREGALLEAVAEAAGTTRVELLRGAVLGSAALLAALAAPEAASAARRGKVLDTAILNYGLTFEYLQAGFYTEAETLGTVGAMPPEQALWARTLGAHERAHVRILKQVLGKNAAARPFFDYRGVTEDPADFTRTAVAMEDLTVALLGGQAPRMSERALRAAFFSLLTVEARHAAWARRIVGLLPVASALDRPKSLAAVDRIVRSTRFIVSRPKTGGKARPRFTG